ncbi:PAS domain S-box/diguanylate cyclase (GGDEF) domain-containing protein [Desulfitobacterium dehalogenans ATCC 51507]|uniref:PAS domain S-box/diguanylate cyclase (GGDEF) domain-containing protein n=1 Tax=Desulfitobacterium dehalogenans (strain ATCC 51507 / DSM 9161 / JW/IU-DC1) TaxID=756499 RepID=I4AE01_DESDJ|nr:HD domain-containing phosphohydrolase [Desulfitobacterium dehalogenans]AFM02186.1 PAS domain S-box/diguanylate cyclase (GGDEF) domain-containing protein [Desulfitobacterium dehalogenans ATCC 51507]
MRQDIQDVKLMAILNLLNQLSNKNSLEEYLNGIIDFLSGWTGCENIGIRVLREAGLAPYVVYRGFDEDFIASESCISVHEDECVCLRVLRQQFKNEDQDHISESGTYYAQNFFQYVEELKEDQLLSFRGICANKKFKSLAVIPLHHQGKVVGVIHIADVKSGVFSQEDIQFIETIRPLVAEAIYRHNLEKALESTVRRYEAEEMVIRKLKFEERLASISARFNQQEDFKVAAEESLKDILKLFKAEQVCLHLGSNLKEYVSVHEHGKSTHGCSISPKTFKELKIHWEKGNILCQKPAHQAEFKEIGSLAHEVFKKDSVLTIPLNFKGSLLGVLIFVNISSGGLPFKEILNPLKLVTETFANAVEQGRIQYQLMWSENRYRTIFNHSGSAFLIVDENLKILLSNPQAERLLGLPSEKMDNIAYLTDFLPDNEVRRLKEYNRKRLQQDSHVPRQYEVKYKDNQGNLKDVIVSAEVIPQTIQTVLSIIDITEWKKAEAELQFLNLHDRLTGLYNRVYFEQELRKYEADPSKEVGLIMCDVNGLKLINTTFGSEAGDQVLVTTARLLDECFKDYLVARIGGDEFAVLIEKNEDVDLEQACQLFRRNVEKYNKDHDGYPLDISLGYACSGSCGLKMSELLRNADDAMGREKLHSNNSTRNSQVQILTKALEFRDFITEGHAERVQNLIISTGQLAGLSEQRLSDLKLFAQFHDIGKVGIPDQILFKKGRLTADEWKIMKEHCEMGHRIAQSTPDIYPIADWILKHHENWDGSGYPLGLKGEEIPIECRILAVADTFDAMTNDRPYRKAQSTQAAIEEIMRCAGAQFDPHIVELFVKTV